MEPVTTTAIITLLSYWGGKTFEKAFDTAGGEFTKEGIKWLKSLFFEEDKPKEVLKKYQERPDSPARQNAIRAAIETELEDNPQAKAYLQQLVKGIAAKTGGTTITDSQNVVTGTIRSGRNSVVGNNNQLHGDNKQ